MVPLGQSRHPVIIFTDGFCDTAPGGKAVYGAVILGRATHTHEAFGQTLLQDVAEEIEQTVGAEQIVAQAELLAVVAAKEPWTKQLMCKGGRRVVVFIDNDAARYGLIEGHSPSGTSGWPVCRPLEKAHADRLFLVVRQGRQRKQPC